MCAYNLRIESKVFKEQFAEAARSEAERMWDDINKERESLVKAVLVEDGTMFHGETIGAQGTCIGEIVFSTGMTGYQEVLSGPLICGATMALTHPIVGNYGVNPENTESDKIHLMGL